MVPVDDPVFLFASDGAAAVEQALKIAFQYWWNQGVTERTAFLALGDAYHGDTVGSLSLGAGGFGTDLFDPLRFPGVIRGPGYRQPGWLDAALACALAQHGPAPGRRGHRAAGAGGGRACTWPAPEDVRRFGTACQDAGVLLVCDEVATGFGRTGTLFASDQCGLRPDLMAHGQGPRRPAICP